MMVGSNVWSQIGSGNSISVSDDTRCSNCHFYMSNVSISESTALSHASGNVICIETVMPIC
jgi:hypothetical protein